MWRRFEEAVTRNNTYLRIEALPKVPSTLYEPGPGDSRKEAVLRRGS